MRLTADADKKRKLLKPMVSMVANMHGNEVVGIELLVHLAKVLVMGYNFDSRIQQIMDKTEIHIVPSMNPDGWRRAEEGDCGGQDFYAGRLNYNRVDLNRNFPVDGISFKSSSLHDQEPGTKALK